MRLDSLDRLRRAADTAALHNELAERYPEFQTAGLAAMVVVGAAEEGERLVRICDRVGIEVVRVVDDNPDRRSETVAGVKVDPVDALDGADRALPVVIASHRTLKITERLRNMGFEHVAPFALLQVLDPDRFTPHMFYDGWLEDLTSNCRHYCTLSNLLADDESRVVLDRVLAYRLDLDPVVLSPVIEWDLYEPKNLIPWSAEEVLIDGGAFDGDSVRLFLDRLDGSLRRVYAFEPDPATHARLQDNFAHDPRVFPVNKGLYRATTDLRFEDGGARGSLFSEQGGQEIGVVALDDFMADERITFIKMNIEGCELDALDGARRVITRWRAALASSAYHRPRDLWRVPLMIRSMEPEYRLYLRQHDGGVIETVVYAVA